MRAITADRRWLRAGFWALLLVASVAALSRVPFVGDILKHGSDILYLAQQQLVLVAISVSLAILTGLGIGMVLTRPWAQRFAEPVIQVINVAASIPTLAKLAIAMSLLGIGALPAIIGLWIVSLLPIVRNTYEGIRAVPAHLIDAATGMGMRPGQILWRVEVINALFVIFAGIRTAFAFNVGTAPLAFLIGGGGLGELIFTGIDLNEPAMMLAGAIPTALLAIAIDFLVAQIQYWLVPRGVNPLRQRTQ